MHIIHTSHPPPGFTRFPFPSRFYAGDAKDGPGEKEGGGFYGGNVIIVLYSHSCVCTSTVTTIVQGPIRTFWSGKEIPIPSIIVSVVFLSPRLVNV